MFILLTHLSTAWEDDVKKFGSFKFSNGAEHNNIESLNREGLMPLEVARKDNPYVDAFWKWWPRSISEPKSVSYDRR